MGLGRANNARTASASLWLPKPDGLQLQDNKLEPHAMNLTLSDRNRNKNTVAARFLLFQSTIDVHDFFALQTDF